MFRTKTLSILAVVVLLSITPMIGLHAGAAKVGTVIFQDDQGTNDSVVISIEGMSAPPSGSTHNASFTTSDGLDSLSLGEVVVDLPIIHGVIQATGNGSLTFNNTSAGYDGTDLVSRFNRFTVKEEPAGTVLYSGSIDKSAMTSISATMQDASSLNSSLASAIDSANLAKDASDLEGTRSNANDAVANVDQLIASANSMSANATAVAEAASSDTITASSTVITAISTNIINAVNNAKASAESASTQSGVSVANIFAGSVYEELSEARNGGAASGRDGSTQAYSIAQQMATITVVEGDHSTPEYTPPTPVPPTPEPTPEPTPVPTPVPTPEPTPTPIPTPTPTPHLLDEPGLPSVGDESASMIMKMSLLAGIMLAGLGGFLVIVRSRESQ